MFTIHREELDWGGRKLVLETGRIARQADGAIFASYGETTVLATVVAAKEPKVGIRFSPLTVNYQEKSFAAGRIPGGFFKREGRPTERETLTSRLIDRPIRPLFPEGFISEMQVIVTCCRTTRRTIPTSWRWSPPRPPSRSRACRSWARSAPRASASSTARYMLNPTHRRDDRDPPRPRRRRHARTRC